MSPRSWRWAIPLPARPRSATSQPAIALQIRRRVLATYYVDAVQSGMMSTIPPFGHNDREQGVVKLMLTLRSRGHTCYAIAKRLDAWGLPPRIAGCCRPQAVDRVLRRASRHHSGDAAAIVAQYDDAPRCVWCHVAIEVGGAPYCRKCGHRSDTPRFRCDCPKCKPDR